METGDDFLLGKYCRGGEADDNTGIDITVPNDGTHFVARSPDHILDQFKISVGAGGATTLSTNDADATAANLTLDVDGDIVLVAKRDFQDEKVDIVHKYTADEARNLKQYGELPETARINETAVDMAMGGDDDDNDIGIDFDDI